MRVVSIVAFDFIFVTTYCTTSRTTLHTFVQVHHGQTSTRTNEKDDDDDGGGDYDDDDDDDDTDDNNRSDNNNT